MIQEYMKNKKRKIIFLVLLFILMIVCFIACVFVGSSHMSLIECIKAILYKSSDVNNKIMYKIRIPRSLACVFAGALLSLSGLIMQTNLKNPLASPSTLGVSNASVFGANLAMIVFAGGFLSSGSNINNYVSKINPFQTTFFAFLFSLICIILILALCRKEKFNPNTVVLAGIAIGSIFSALTTLIQYFATDVGISASIIWSFGDLSRATYTTDLIMFIALVFSFIFFEVISMKYNSLLNGDEFSISVGINVNRLRFISLFISSVLCALCVSFLGIIGFVGIICPHIMKRILGHDHRYLIPASILSGSILLLFSDTLAKIVGNGTSLPIGAITSILGAPFFLYIIFSKKEIGKC